MAGGLCPWGPLPRQRREDRKKGPGKTKSAQRGPSMRGVAYPAPADPAFAGTAVKPKLTLRSPCLVAKHDIPIYRIHMVGLGERKPLEPRLATREPRTAGSK